MSKIRNGLLTFLLLVTAFQNICGQQENNSVFQLILSKIDEAMIDSSEYAKELVQEYHNQAIKTNDKKKLAESYYLFGYIYLESDFEKAGDYVNKGIELAKQLPDSSMLAELYFQKGLIKYYASNNKEALKCYYLALNYYMLHDMTQEIADSYQNMGMIWDDLDDTTRALDYYLKSLELNHKLKNEKRIASISHNIGVLYASKKNELDVALKYYNEALEHFEKTGFLEGEATAVNNIGELFEKKGDYQEALVWYKKSLNIFERLNQLRPVTIVLYNIGNAYKGMEKFEMAKIYLLKSAELSKQLTLEDFEADAYFQLSEIFQKEGDFEKSLTYFKMYNTIDDSLFSIENQAKIEEIEAEFNNELTDKELALKTKKLNRKTQILYVFGLGAFLFMIVIILLFFENRKKVKAEKQLMNHKNHLERMIKKSADALRIEMSERKIAEESDKLKSAFLANMSHEIRTPMNSIIAFSNYLKEEGLSKDKKDEYVQYIISCGKNLLQLINDILDIAKIEAYQLKIHKETCNISELLNEVYQIFKESKSQHIRNIKFHLNKHFLHDNVIIESDYNRLMQIFTNLLENSFKYTNKGSIEFGIEKIKNNLIFFYVRDTGTGIPLNKNRVVFERFQQAENAIDKKSGGTGLGLAICKNLIELMGGKIWVVSANGSGTTVSFTLPYLPVETKGIKRIRSKRKEDFKKEYVWKNKIILVAEDEELNYKVIEIALLKTKADIKRVKNGTEAVEYFKNNQVDLILMDIQMPVMDGFKATQKIKELDSTVPIIAQTSFAMHEDKNKCLEAGCDDFITKPLNIDTLYKKIDSFLQINAI